MSNVPPPGPDFVNPTIQMPTYGPPTGPVFPSNEPTEPEPSGPRRKLPLRAIGIVAAALVALALIVALNPIGAVKDWIFGTDPQAQAGPSTLIQIRDTAELKAATGTFSVPVYLDDSNKSALEDILPGVLTEEQIVALYYGEVDATVDLSELPEENIRVDESTNTLTIRVPEPVLGKPNIDESQSKIVAHSRGILPRINDAFGSTPLEKKQLLDEKAVGALSVAAEDSNLKATAQSNAKDFLESLGKSMGYDTVIVEFGAGPIS